MHPVETIRSKTTAVVVSNRLPYNLPREPAKRPKRNVGGLVNALEPVLAARGGSWVGWDGLMLSSTAAAAASREGPGSVRTENGIELVGVPLSEREIRRYYHGFSNRALWPLLHSLLDKAVFDPEDYAAYRRVNRRFAEKVLRMVGDRGDRIWVHDYHLMLVPGMLRELGYRGRIDFFLHIPFPAAEVFRVLPWRDELIRGLLGADAVAMHVGSYRDNFVRTAELYGSSTEDLGEGNVALIHDAGSTVAAVAPIGVDVDDFARIAELPAVEAKVQRIRGAYAGRRILFSADRLDYTKGIKERLLAVDRFLTSHPQAAGTFTMLQIVVPSRHQVEEYRKLKREIDEEVGRINGEHGREGWVPIHYRYTSLGREELVAHYRAASVALVTPLRDGLNLVAPEFVASRPDHDGVLVLSEFAGVAEFLRGAVLVNPYDIDGCAEAIHHALEMDLPERRFRMNQMHEQVRSNSNSRWAERCLSLPTVERALGRAPGLPRARWEPAPIRSFATK